MTDFDIQQIKNKLEQDIKEVTKQAQNFEKEVSVLLKKNDVLDDTDPDVLISDKEEEIFLIQIQDELDESLNNAVLDLAGKKEE